MLMTNEEKNLLEELASGALDGIVGDDVTTTGGSTVWKAIKKRNRSRFLTVNLARNPYHGVYGRGKHQADQPC